MKTARGRRRIALGVESSFFPRARKAMEERLRAQGGVSEPRQKGIWEFIPEETSTPPAGTPPVEHPEIMRPGYQPSYTRPDPSEAFGVPKMWAFVDKKRREPGYVPQNFVVDILTPPVVAADEVKRQMETIGHIAMFFGVPAAAFQGLTIDQAWTQVIGPMFEEFERMMNRGRPAYMSGMLRFDLSPQSELAIVYYDR